MLLSPAWGNIDYPWGTFPWGWQDLPSGILVNSRYFSSKGDDMAKNVEAFEKQPNEAYNITYDMTKKMKSGAAISSFVTGYPKATRMSDSTDTTATVLGASSISSPVITQWVKAGSNGERHKIEWRVNDNSNPAETVEGEVIMEVVER